MSDLHPDLLRKQKNQVFRTIQNSGMNVEHFEWTRDKKQYSSQPCPTLQHSSSMEYFMFCTPSGGNDSWQFKCKPGANHPVDSGLVRNGWPGILLKVEDWARSLRDELFLPDLWEQASVFFKESASAYSDDCNTSFSKTELSKIAEGVNRIEMKLLEIADSQEIPKPEKEFVKQTLAHLVLLADNGMGRIDWRNQLVGVLLNLIIHIGLNPEIAIGLFGQLQGLTDSFVKLVG